MPETEKTPFVLTAGGKAFGPCGSCAWYNPTATRAAVATGSCHGRAPGRDGHPIVSAMYAGCADFRRADAKAAS
jgi:hypothetical protein